MSANILGNTFWMGVFKMKWHAEINPHSGWFLNFNNSFYHEICTIPSCGLSYDHLLHHSYHSLPILFIVLTFCDCPRATELTLKKLKKSNSNSNLDYFIYARYIERCNTTYRQTSNVKRIKSQNVNVSRLVLQLSFRIPLKPCVKSRMSKGLEQRRQASKSY